MYAVDCDFNGFDIGNSPSPYWHLCREKCLLNAQCTHFTWSMATGTCWIKRAADLTNPLSFPVIYTHGNVCGYKVITKRKAETSSEKTLTTERVQGIVNFVNISHSKSILINSFVPEHIQFYLEKKITFEIFNKCVFAH